MTGDEIYGGARQLRLWLEAKRHPSVLATKRSEPLWVLIACGPLERPATGTAATRAAEDWTRVAIRPLREPGWKHWLLVRRTLSDPEDIAYYVCFTPAGTLIDEFVRVAGERWMIESCIEEAKRGTGPV